MTISYELSSPAETQVAIRMGGRVVRRLSTGRAAATGVNQFVWDMRDDQGRTLPAGAYLLEIMARSPEGDQTRTAAPILITR
jgi:flagellar hook assembly protein FlgD